MKEINFYYTINCHCQQTIEVPDTFEIPESKFELIEKLKREFPEDEIWDTLPKDDTDTEISDHYYHIYSSDIENEVIGDDVQLKFFIDSVQLNPK